VRPLFLDDSIETVPDDAVETAPIPINYSLAASVLIGDFFHNFSDGILLGTAFSLCHRELALTITVATIYHEIAQEIADFYLLTKHCNLKIPMALCLNFLGGLSVMLGGIFILSFDINSMVTGCVLALGSGVYMYIAAAECYPRAKASHRTVTDKLLSLLAWVVGVVPIGLVLLNHGHCEA
jgi:zinc transporter ZupT